VYRYFACLCAEHITLNADKVANVEQTFEHGVIEVFIIVGADVVACNIHLYTSLRVLQFYEAGLAHYAAAHHTSSNHYLLFLVFVLEVVLDVF